MSITRTDTYQRITDTIIDALEAGTRPWIKPWNDRDPGSGLPRPLRAGGEPYRGINVLLLWIACATHGFQQGRFMTYTQAQERGGQVRKGEKGTTIVKYGTITRVLEGEAGQEYEREIPYLKAYSVFEVSQIDNLPPEFYGAAEPLAREERLDHVDRASLCGRCRLPTPDPLGPAPMDRPPRVPVAIDQVADRVAMRHLEQARQTEIETVRAAGRLRN